MSAKQNKQGAGSAEPAVPPRDLFVEMNGIVEEAGFAALRARELRECLEQGGVPDTAEAMLADQLLKLADDAGELSAAIRVGMVACYFLEADPQSAPAAKSTDDPNRGVSPYRPGERVPPTAPSHP